MSESKQNKRRLLRAMRIIHGLEQVELGKRCGLSQPHISLIENGKLNPQPDTIRRISEALGADPSTIFPDLGGGQ